MKTVIILGILAFEASAQIHTEPPPLLQFIRRPGIDATSIRQYRDAGVAISVFGMTSLTGPAETWLIEAHDSFASIEQVDEAVRPFTLDKPSDDRLEHLTGDMLAGSRILIAACRPGLSYRPDQAIRMFPKARFFHVSVYRIRAGAEVEFSEFLKLRKGRFDNINLDMPDIAYQVLSGAPAGTYLFLAPLVSLKTLDEGLATTPGYTEPGSAAGTAANKAAIQGQITRSHLLFRVEPRISNVSDDFASEAPEFWRPRPKPQ